MLHLPPFLLVPKALQLVKSVNIPATALFGGLIGKTQSRKFQRPEEEPSRPEGQI